MKRAKTTFMTAALSVLVFAGVAIASPQRSAFAYRDSSAAKRSLAVKKVIVKINANAKKLQGTWLYQKGLYYDEKQKVFRDPGADAKGQSALVIRGNTICPFAMLYDVTAGPECMRSYFPFTLSGKALNIQATPADLDAYLPKWKWKLKGNLLEIIKEQPLPDSPEFGRKRPNAKMKEIYKRKR